MLGELYESLRSMSLLQLALAFFAWIAYALAQGSLLAFRGRAWAALVAFASAATFALMASDWTLATMLVAFAVVTTGVLIAIVWLTSAALGLRPVPLSLETPSSLEGQMQRGHASAVTAPAPLG